MSLGFGDVKCMQAFNVYFSDSFFCVVAISDILCKYMH